MGGDIQAIWAWLNANTGAVTAMAAMIAAGATAIYALFTIFLWITTLK
jgi:hypothetical protein